MITTKRQKALKKAFTQIANEDGHESILELGQRLRRKGIDDDALKRLEIDETIDAERLTALEAALSDLQAAKGPVKALLVRASRCGVNQVQLAELAGVSAVTLSRWANGKYNPTPDNLDKLSEAVYGVESGSPISA